MQQIDEIVPLAYRSLESRATLGLSSAAPLGARQLAAHLGIRVWTPDDVPGLSPDARKVLLRNDGTPNCWSAVTLVVGEETLVILNSSHSPARQASDLMHELAHRIRNHEPEEMSISSEGMMLLKAYDKEQEEEADWLAGWRASPAARCARPYQTPRDFRRGCRRPVWREQEDVHLSHVNDWCEQTVSLKLVSFSTRDDTRAVPAVSPADER